MSASHWFSDSYQEASLRFINQVEKLKNIGHDVLHERLNIGLYGPSSEELAIDIAVIGSLDSKKMFLYSSGVHGVEGFSGSAIQLSILDQLSREKPFNNYCIVFIHTVNPYGMAWYRRVNENNVDLNRNFISEGTKYDGEPDGYKLIDYFLNPKSTPKKIDWFFFISGWYLVLKYGFNNIKQWIAQGQYTRPSSLQYGGDKMQTGPTLIVEWLKKNISNIKSAVAVDLHTGLGPSGYDTILTPDDVSPKDYNILKEIYQDHVSPLNPNEGVGYRVIGDLHSGITSYFSDIKWIYVTQEFGTFSPMTVFKSLRAENMWTQNNKSKTDKNSSNHWTRKKLLHNFNPNDDIWQSKIINRGKEVFKISRDYLLNS